MLSRDHCTSGRLTTRQLKYAAETYFRSFVSLQFYKKSAGPVEQSRHLPCSDETARILSNYFNASYEVVLAEGKPWMPGATIQAVTSVLDAAPKPVLLYADDRSVAALVVLLYFARDGQHDGPTISADDVFTIGRQLGFDYRQRRYARYTGRDAKNDTTLDEVTYLPALPYWYDAYWPAKAVSGNWYFAGQIYQTSLSDIERTGFKTIINFRKGVTTGKTCNPSQEEVALLNVKEATGTYHHDGNRQSGRRLRQNRIDAEKASSYISPHSTNNYETTNAEEFGDDVGYNETFERQTIERTIPGVKYIHMPVGE